MGAPKNLVHGNMTTARFLESLLELPYETSLIFKTPTLFEVWKGGRNQCPYLSAYKTMPYVVGHTHPSAPAGQHSPPSPQDLVNCLESTVPHLVFAREGTWVFTPGEELAQEWRETPDQEGLEAVLRNNLTGLLFEYVGLPVAKKLGHEEFVRKVAVAVPRKDPQKPPLGFSLRLDPLAFPPALPPLSTDATTVDREPHLWSVDEDPAAVLHALEAAAEGTCVTSDGSVVV